jgi:DNA-binding MarR family transcriptional regulator
MVKRRPDPADAARNCACFNLRKAARAVTQLYEAALAPSGMRATQFSVLTALALVDSAPLSRVADWLVMDRTTLTRNLRPLTRRGWVRIEAGEDRRERYLSLTRSGRAALDRALPLWQQAQTRLHSHVGDPRWGRLLADLQRLVATAQGATGADGRG